MRPVARITVAVAACDRPAPLARCLEAIARGATLPSQLVVVDQSADGAVEAEVAKVLLPGVAVHYIRQPRRGLRTSCARCCSSQARTGAHRIVASFARGC